MVWLSQIAAAHALALASASPLPIPSTLPTPAAEHGSTLWAGHQVTFGRRSIPFKGEVETRMDSFVLARMRRDGDVIELEQTACHVRFSKVAGVTVHMNAGALPSTRMVFAAAPRDEGAPQAHGLQGRSIVAWSTEDLDDDGHPGVTVRVQAPVCSGELYVSNRSRTRATATLDAERLRGRATVHVKQEILGADGACLEAVAKATDERQSGPFAYVPVPEDTTCETLLRRGWPVIAK